MRRIVLCLIFFLPSIVICGATGRCSNPCVTAENIRESCSYQKIGQKCYYKFYNLTNWRENRELCEGQGLEMVRLTKETFPHMAQLEFDARYDKPDSCKDGMWLAGRTVEKLAFLNYTDVRQTPIGIAPSVHALTNDRDKSCGYMSQEHFTLKIGRCTDNKYFVCRYDVNQFVAFKEKKTWFQARETCIHTGGDLFYLKKDDDVTLESIKRLTSSTLRAASIASDDDFHIGAVRRIWIWSGGEHITAYNWNKGEPSHFWEKCLMFNNDGKWNDEYCGILFPSICQADLSKLPKQQPARAVIVKGKMSERMTNEDQCNHSCLDLGNPKCSSKKIGGYCYFHFEGRRSWSESKRLCKSQALEMVQHLLFQERSRITSWVSDNRKSRGRSCKRSIVWLGGAAEKLDKWSFLDHRNVIPTSYTTGTEDYNNCGYMVIGNNYTLKTGSCSNKEYFLCRYDGNTLKAFRQQKNWFEARGTCQRDGADLFYMYPTEAILDAMISALEEASIVLGEIFHVGLVHRIWKWQDGAHILSSNWGDFEPNNYDEGCLEGTIGVGIWNDAKCSEDFETLCRRKSVSAGEEKTTTQGTRTTPGGITPSISAPVTTPEQIVIQALLGVFALGCVILLTYILVRWCSQKKGNGQNRTNPGNHQEGNEEQAQAAEEDYCYAYIKLDEMAPRNEAAANAATPLYDYATSHPWPAQRV